MTIYLKDYQPPENLYKKVISKASDFPDVIDPLVLYEIDGNIDMGTTSIEIPADGIAMRGLGLKVSSLYSSEDNYTLFTASVGGSGDVDFEDFSITVSGDSSQVYDITGATGFEALEIIKINYINCTSLGTITNYRQAFESGTGRLGGTPTLTLAGTWLGGYRVTSTISVNLDPAFNQPLFKAGTAFTMNGRFLTDTVCNLPDTSASFADFSSSNFLQPSLLQVTGATFTRNGVIQEDSQGFFPNILPSDIASSWTGNNGINNTHEGGRLQVTSQSTTTITTSGVFVDVAGTFTSSNLQHFSSPSNGQLQNDGITPTEFILLGSLVLESGANNEVSVKIVKWDSGTSQFMDVYTQNGTVISLSGSRDVCIMPLYYPVTLHNDDFIKLQVANQSGTTNITLEDNSFYQLYKQ